MSLWYVVQTKVRQEAITQANLQRQGYRTYCPFIMHSRRRQGIWQKVSEPLFPRYLFIQLTEGEDNFAPIRSTVGVSKLVRFGDKPAHISEKVIDVIRQQEYQLKQGASDAMPWKEGDKVHILEGALSGLTGIFKKKGTDERVIILLELLGKENQVEINGNILATYQ